MKNYLRILTFVKPYWKHLSASIIFTILFALLSGASIYLTIPLLDTLFQETSNQEKIETQSEINDSSSFLPDFISDPLNELSTQFKSFVFSGDKTDVLIKVCILIILAFFGKNFFGYLQAYYLAYVEQGVIRDLRAITYKHLHKLPMSYFKGEKTGNLISFIMNNVNVVQQSVAAVFLNLIREPLTIVVFLGIALSISVKLTLFSLVVLPFTIVIIAYIGLKIRKQSFVLQEKMADITTILHETITGVKIVKAFGMENYENKKFIGETNSFFKMHLKMVRVKNIASPVTEFLSVLVGAIIIYYGGTIVLQDSTIKASEFSGFLFAILQLMRPVKELSGVNNRVQEASAAAERVFEILDTEPDIKDTENPVAIDDFKEGLKFDHIKFKYDDSDEMVLDDVSFNVNKGEIVALVGSSGAGKTTIADLIPRFFDPIDGEILIDGKNIKSYSVADLRKLLGIVTQETVLFNESIKNNIAYGLSNYSQEKIEEAARAANAHRFIIEIPEKYDAMIGEKGTKLSGGQRQRLSIARAILKNPPIMILDEATSALDNESEVLVQEALERLMADRTTIVIAHRLSTIRNADKIIVLEKGKIVQQGKHVELIKDETGLYKKLYELQFRG